MLCYKSNGDGKGMLLPRCRTIAGPAKGPYFRELPLILSDASPRGYLPTRGCAPGRHLFFHEEVSSAVLCPKPQTPKHPLTLEPELSELSSP